MSTGANGRAGQVRTGLGCRAWLLVAAAASGAVFPSLATAQVPYTRPVTNAPSEESIGDGYVTPPVQRPAPRADWWGAVDAGVLLLTLILATWIVLRRRSRRALVVLTIACLLYFGFWRKGCVCPIGAIQNMTVAFTDSTYAVPVVVIFFFLVPLAMAFLFSRAFCAGVCPLGAIQDLVLLKPVQVPRRLDRVLSSFRYVYLVLAIVFAAGWLSERDFVICRYDPFVGFFRWNGSAEMLMAGGGLLLIGLFVGRPYCRYLCPYGAVLGLCSRYAWRGVTITPDKELDCGLCVQACPFGAIENMRASRSKCLMCGRCYAACPRESQHRSSLAGQKAESEQEVMVGAAGP